MAKEHDMGYRWWWLRPATRSSFLVRKFFIKYKEAIFRFGRGLTADEANTTLNTIQTYQQETLNEPMTESNGRVKSHPRVSGAILGDLKFLSWFSQAPVRRLSESLGLKKMVR